MHMRFRTLTLRMTMLGLAICVTSVSEGAFYRLDYSGLLTHTSSTIHQDGILLATPVEFSGYIVLDGTTPADSINDTIDNFSQMSVAGSISIGSDAYEWVPDIFNLTSVRFGGNSGDFFGTFDRYTNENNDEFSVIIQFQVLAGDWLDEPGLPGPFNLDDVDSIDFQSALSTQLIFLNAEDPSNAYVYGAFTSVEFRQVPLPAGIYLMISALLALRAYRNERDPLR